MINFAERLKTIRKENGMTQMQLSEKSGLSQSNINTWERGRSLPLPDGLIALADCFNCSIDYLLGRESEDGTIIINSSANTLNAEENSMIKKFRILNKRRKELAICYLNGLYDGQLKDNIGG